MARVECFVVNLAGNFLPLFSEVLRGFPFSACSTSGHTDVLICVATGPGWSLHWPAAAWQRLTDQEKTAVIAAQTALMNPSENAGIGGKIRVGEAQ